MGFNRSLRAPMKAPASTDESGGMSAESLGGVPSQMLQARRFPQPTARAPTAAPIGTASLSAMLTRACTVR